MGVLLIDIKAAFPSMARRRLIKLIMVNGIDGDLIQWTESFLAGRKLEIVIEDNVLQSDHVEPGVPLRSPVSPIHFIIHTTGQVKWVEE